MTPSQPIRGEVWTVEFPEGRGSEQRGRRPALVIQNDVGNRFARTTIVAVITSTIKSLPVMVTLKKGDGGVSQECAVNAAQLFTLDKSRLGRRMGVLGPSLMQRVNDALRISLEVG